MSKFIVLEGIDGVGKTTQAVKLAARLFDDKRNQVLLTREPTYSTYGMELRRRLSSDKDPRKNAREYLKLFILDRKEHQDILFRAYEAGIFIIGDRYFLSTFAYQWTQGLPLSYIIQQHQEHIPNLLMPDITFLLDVNVDIALRRLTKDQKGDVFHKKQEFLEELRNNYLRLLRELGDSFGNIVKINANRDQDSVLENMMSIIHKDSTKH